MARQGLPDDAHWSERFSLLHQGFGIWGGAVLYDFLGKELRALWGVTLRMRSYDEELWDAVAPRLRNLIADFIPATIHPMSPSRLMAVRLSLELSYNVADEPKYRGLKKRETGARQEVLKDEEEGVAKSTARAYVTQAIKQFLPIIETQLKANHLIPESDTLPGVAEELQPLATDVAAHSVQAATEQVAEDSSPPQETPEPQADEHSTHSEAAPDSPPASPPTPPKPKPLFTSQATKALMREDWATPDDDVLGVLAFSNGKEAGAIWACEVLFHKWVTDASGGSYPSGNDMVRIERTMRLAKKRGINKQQMQKARRELALSGALIVPAGRYDLVDTGLSRYHEPWGINRKIGAFDDDHVVMREFQRLCLHSGRLDLAGDWRDETVWNHGEDIAARTDRAVIDGVSCAVSMAGMQKASLAQLVNVHPIALLSISYVAGQVFRRGTTVERLNTAIRLLEIITGSATPTTRGDRHHYLSQLLYDLREFEVSSLERSTLAEQLAVHVGSLPDAPPFNGEALLARTRLR